MVGDGVCVCLCDVDAMWVEVMRMVACVSDMCILKVTIPVQKITRCKCM